MEYEEEEKYGCTVERLLCVQSAQKPPLYIVGEGGGAHPLGFPTLKGATALGAKGGGGQGVERPRVGL